MVSETELVRIGQVSYFDRLNRLQGYTNDPLL
jgi:hypothetical protein